jgi:hypothetical protein
VDNWRALQFHNEEDWNTGIEIFEDRIRGRFLKHIERIQGYEFAGFAVLALDCLLIEALMQFRAGTEATQGKVATSFSRFLTETSFRDYFDPKTADLFYQQIRNGILHQAEVKATSLVRIDANLDLVKLTEDKTGLIINRNKFHQQLVKVFEEYVTDLRNPSQGELRANFRKKMDYICRVQLKSSSDFGVYT